MIKVGEMVLSVKWEKLTQYALYQRFETVKRGQTVQAVVIVYS